MTNAFICLKRSLFSFLNDIFSGIKFYIGGYFLSVHYKYSIVFWFSFFSLIVKFPMSLITPLYSNLLPLTAFKSFFSLVFWIFKWWAIWGFFQREVFVFVFCLWSKAFLSLGLMSLNVVRYYFFKYIFCSICSVGLQLHML